MFIPYARSSLELIVVVISNRSIKGNNTHVDLIKHVQDPSVNDFSLCNLAAFNVFLVTILIVDLYKFGRLACGCDT